MISAVELYTFLNYCNNSPLDKGILECGAGIDSSQEPLLVRFFDYGYETHGIEISEERLFNAREYCKENELDLNIRKGDMRQIPFDDEAMSFVFTYNKFFHMTKDDIGLVMGEIKRVLKPEGLCFVNFLSVDSLTFGVGEEIEKGEYVVKQDDEDLLQSYFEDDEPDPYFADFKVLHKEKRIREWLERGERKSQAYIDYIAMKR